MTIYVSNLSYSITDDHLKNIFTPYGIVSSAKVMIDKFTNKSRGFGFVDMDNNDDANKAITALNGSNFEGRTIIVNEARAKK